MSLHSACLWERMFSSIPSLSPLLEAGHQDITRIHKTTAELHRTPLRRRLQVSPARSTTAPLPAKRTGCRTASAAARGDGTVTSPADLSETAKQVPRRLQGCGPNVRAVFLNQGVMLTLPRLAQSDIKVCEERSVEPHTEQPVYIATDSSFQNRGDNFCERQHWEAQCSAAAPREYVARVVGGFVFPCGPALLWGLLSGYSCIQLWWSRSVASSSPCPRGDILYQVVLICGLKPPLVTLLLQLSRPTAGFRLVSPG